MPWPDDETRNQCGDVLLVGGTFYLDGATLTLRNGCSFPVSVQLRISKRTGITFPKVTLAKHLQDGKIGGRP